MFMMLPMELLNQTDNLVIIDDSIVRGNNIKEKYHKMMDRLNPKKIIVVSSAPQIRYPRLLWYRYG